MGHGCHTCGSPNSCECPTWGSKEFATTAQIDPIDFGTSRGFVCKWCHWIREEDGPCPECSDPIPLPDNPISPAHYRNLDPEPITVIRSWGLDKDHYRATALTYIVRAGIKGGAERYAEDLRKAIQYLQWAVDNAEGK